MQTECFPSRLTPVTLHPGYDFDDIWSPSTVSQVLTHSFHHSFLWQFENEHIKDLNYAICDLELCFLLNAGMLYLEV